MQRSGVLLPLLVPIALGVTGCRKKQTVAPPVPATPPATTAAVAPSSGPSSASNLVFKAVHFELDRADLTVDAMRQLADGAARLLKDPALRIRVEGHADERGGTEYNLALSERRAHAIRTYLMDLGVQRERIETVAYGEERPIASGHDEPSWAANRRGELRVDPGTR